MLSQSLRQVAQALHVSFAVLLAVHSVACQHQGQPSVLGLAANLMCTCSAGVLGHTYKQKAG